MQKFRKKPVVIEAVHFEYTKERLMDISEFMGVKDLKTAKDRRIGALAELEIPTLEDGSKNQVKHIATEGDWIIRGVQGEFYPCKPKIFDATYEAI